MTADGAAMLYIGGPIDIPNLHSGAGLSAEFFTPSDSMMFVGTIETVDENNASGDGIVIGQNCAVGDGGRFCDGAASADISISRASPTESTFQYSSTIGEIRVETDGTDETWMLDIDYWSAYYDFPGSGSGPSGLYREKLARFAREDTVIVSIDDGRMFFQSPGSGCIGNGTLSQHSNGDFYVFDVDLLIESCYAAYGYLNGEFDGIVTETQNGAWDYDVWLIMFLSARTGSPSPAAVTMLAPQSF